MSPPRPVRNGKHPWVSNALRMPLRPWKPPCADACRRTAAAWGNSAPRRANRRASMGIPSPAWPCPPNRYRFVRPRMQVPRRIRRERPPRPNCEIVWHARSETPRLENVATFVVISPVPRAVWCRRGIVSRRSLPAAKQCFRERTFRTRARPQRLRALSSCKPPSRLYALLLLKRQPLDCETLTHACCSSEEIQLAACIVVRVGFNLTLVTLARRRWCKGVWYSPT